ncbi:MAG: NYN domain-containing protein [Gemmatimonadota bacterium]
MNDITPGVFATPASLAHNQLSNAALLIDFDNVTMGIRSDLGQELRKLLDSDIIRGKVSVQRAYADWRRYPQYIVPLSEASIELIFAPAYGSTKKNATDIRLAIDALEIVFTRPDIGTFILLSGDSDFSSLVLKLREYGKYVIGVGIQESSSDLLVQNCDEYYSYSTLAGLRAASDIVTERHDPWELAEATIKRMVKRGDVMRSDRFKQVMLEIDPSFSERSLGFSKFNRFMSEAAIRGIVELRKSPNGQYEVAPVKSDAALSAAEPEVQASPEPRGDSSQRTPDSSQRSSRGRGRSGSSGRGRPSGSRSGDGASRIRDRDAAASAAEESVIDSAGLTSAYELLRQAAEDLANRGRSGRDSEVKRRMLQKEPSFDEGAIGFRKFSEFLRRASEEGQVSLVSTDGGALHVRPVGPEPAPSETEPATDGRASKAEPAVSKTSSSSDEQDEDGLTALDRGVRRVLGRFRRGSSGAKAASAATAPAASAVSPASAEATKGAAGRARSQRNTAASVKREASASPRSTRGEPASAPASDNGLLIERMTENYPGVGRRTAESIVSAFGPDVFDVIDQNPNRLRDVLPEHRARAVEAGRRAERERSS